MIGTILIIFLLLIVIIILTTLAIRIFILIDIFNIIKNKFIKINEVNINKLKMLKINFGLCVISFIISMFIIFIFLKIFPNPKPYPKPEKMTIVSLLLLGTSLISSYLLGINSLLRHKKEIQKIKSTDSYLSETILNHWKHRILRFEKTHNIEVVSSSIDSQILFESIYQIASLIAVLSLSLQLLSGNNFNLIDGISNILKWLFEGKWTIYTFIALLIPWLVLILSMNKKFDEFVIKVIELNKKNIENSKK